MSEMVERVQAAIWAELDSDDMPAGGWPELAKQCARSAIAAMREPTDDMVDAGEIEADSDQCVGITGAMNVWQAMLTAALEDPRHG